MNSRKKTTVSPNRSKLSRALFRGPIHGLLPGRPLVQPKLTMSQPGDRDEREADRVADKVTRMPEPKVKSGVNRNETIEKLEIKKADGITDHGRHLTGSVANGIQAVLQGGKPLHESVRSSLELRFGHNLSSVRIHTDQQAADEAEGINAQAFTVGQDIVFGAGQYSPDTSHGRRLLAHELAHVVQKSYKHLIQRQTTAGYASTARTETELEKLKKVYPELEQIDQRIIEKYERDNKGNSCDVLVPDLAKPLVSTGYHGERKVEGRAAKILSGTVFGKDNRTKVTFLWSSSADVHSNVFFKRYLDPIKRPAIFYVKGKRFRDILLKLTLENETVRQQVLELPEAEKKTR